MLWVVDVRHKWVAVVATVGSLYSKWVKLLGLFWVM